MYRTKIYQILSKFLGLYLGALVDRVGIKPFLIINLFGGLVTDIGFIMNFIFIEQLPLQFFYIQLFFGLCGGSQIYFISMYISFYF